MRILIAGASGFVGSHLVSRLRDEHEVFALTRHTLPQTDSGEVHWLNQTLGQPLDYASLPPRVDAVIHLAQSKFYRDFPEQANDIFGVNVHGTLQLLEYARRAEATQFIFTSTGGLYGYSYDQFVETDPVSPLSFYLSSKYMAETLIANYQQFFHTVVLRLFFAYGAGQARAMLIPRLVRSVLSGDPIMLQGTDGLRINPIHVSDVVRTLAQALALKGHHLINLGGPQILSLREIGQIIGTHVGRAPQFTTFVDQNPGQLVGDIGKMKALLGSPSVNFPEGVVDVCREALAI